MKIDTSVNIAGVVWKNPVTTASGTFGYGTLHQEYFNVDALGAICVKTVTLKERIGNPPPRLIETPSGILNSIGLQNKGVNYFLENDLPSLRRITETNVIASIAGENVFEYVKLAELINDKVEMIEINFSCPNVKNERVESMDVFDFFSEVISSVKKVVSVPIIAKISTNNLDARKLAKICEESGADAISLINSLVGMAIDVENRKFIFKNKVGGLSGPAIKPVALRAVYEVRSVVKIPIIGMGGISSAKDAVEFILAGATAVAIGCCGFNNPEIYIGIIDGIEQYMEENDLFKMEQIRILE